MSNESQMGNANSNNPVTVKLPNGREYTPEQLAEFEASGLRQADYTKKTQEIAEERKRIEALQADYDQKAAFAQNMEAVFQADPSIYAKAQAILTGKPVENEPVEQKETRKPVEKQESKTNEIDPIVARMKWEYDKKLQDVTNQLIDIKIKEAKSVLQTKYKLPDEDMEIITARATEDFVPGKSPLENLERAYKTLAFETLQMTQEEQRIKAEEAARIQFFGGKGSGKGGQPTFTEQLMHDVIKENGNNILG